MIRCDYCLHRVGTLFAFYQTHTAVGDSHKHAPAGAPSESKVCPILCYVLNFGWSWKQKRPQEVMELQAANLRLRGVVGDMRREMEAFRGDPRASIGRGGGEREQHLEDENENLR